ncbi:MAG: dockerin type I domain-containing protein, partial [Chloroherpetonaceae bacterium]|nr:dockerin type I domain-containing protein [Chthonomonadaceae bacterium]MDW8208092.1 dockerin type I domain-containing protein [Chloroherpetonaceae bacterium]
PVTVSGSGTVIVPPVTLLGGDANGDDAVDVLDLAELITAFDSSDGDPNWNEGIADFNYDGTVDVFDLAILVQNFDQTGEG